MGANDNRIGKGLMGQKYIPLAVASLECPMCRWLEHGLAATESTEGIEAYATEILLHRRSFHIGSADQPN